MKNNKMKKIMLVFLSAFLLFNGIPKLLLIAGIEDENSFEIDSEEVESEEIEDVFVEDNEDEEENKGEEIFEENLEVSEEESKEDELDTVEDAEEEEKIRSVKPVVSTERELREALNSAETEVILIKNTISIRSDISLVSRNQQNRIVIRPAEDFEPYNYLFLLDSNANMTVKDITIDGSIGGTKNQASGINAQSASRNSGAIKIYDYVTFRNLSRNSGSPNISANKGGAINVENSQLIINGQNVVFENNTSYYGGAIGISGGKLDILNADVKFINNNAVEGGAILIGDRTPATFSSNNISFINNKGSLGGAIYLKGKLDNNQSMDFLFNKATNKGGAIYMEDVATLNINGNSTSFKGNYAQDAGGAIYKLGVDSRIKILNGNTVFENNYTNGEGGAIRMQAYDNNSLITTEFHSKNGSIQFKNNYAKEAGGAIYYDFSGHHFKEMFEMGGSVEFSGNGAGSGGAIYLGKQNAHFLVRPSSNIEFRDNIAGKFELVNGDSTEYGVFKRPIYSSYRYKEIDPQDKAKYDNYLQIYWPDMKGDFSRILKEIGDENKSPIYSKTPFSNHDVNLKFSTKAPIKSYLISYDLNTDDLENNIQSVKVEEGESHKVLSGKELSRDGYKFLGWSTDKSDKKPMYIPEDTQKGTIEKIEEDITLYAIWSKETVYTITYDANGGKFIEEIDDISVIDGASHTVKSGDSIERDGYTFTGWSTDKLSKEPEYTATDSKMSVISNVKDDMTLYAVWEPITYKVSLDSNGGKFVTEVKPSTVNMGDPFTISSDIKIERKGYKLLGWSLTEDATKADYLPGETVEKIEEDLTLYAIWNKETVYTITYDANGGTGKVIDDNEYKLDEEVTVKDGKNLKRDSYEFNGWNTDKEGKGTGYSKEDTFNITKNVILYAQWERVQETLPEPESKVVITFSLDVKPTREDIFTDEEAIIKKDGVETDRVSLKDLYNETYYHTLEGNIKEIEGTYTVEIPSMVGYIGKINSDIVVTKDFEVNKDALFHTVNIEYESEDVAITRYTVNYIDEAGNELAASGVKESTHGAKINQYTIDIPKIDGYVFSKTKPYEIVLDAKEKNQSFDIIYKKQTNEIKYTVSHVYKNLDGTETIEQVEHMDIRVNIDNRLEDKSNDIYKYKENYALVSAEVEDLAEADENGNMALVTITYREISAEEVNFIIRHVDENGNKLIADTQDTGLIDDTLSLEDIKSYASVQLAIEERYVFKEASPESITLREMEEDINPNIITITYEKTDNIIYLVRYRDTVGKPIQGYRPVILKGEVGEMVKFDDKYQVDIEGYTFKKVEPLKLELLEDIDSEELVFKVIYKQDGIEEVEVTINYVTRAGKVVKRDSVKGEIDTQVAYTAVAPKGYKLVNEGLVNIQLGKSMSVVEILVEQVEEEIIPGPEEGGDIGTVPPRRPRPKPEGTPTPLPTPEEVEELPTIDLDLEDIPEGHKVVEDENGNNIILDENDVPYGVVDVEKESAPLGGISLSDDPLMSLNPFVKENPQTGEYEANHVNIAIGGIGLLSFGLFLYNRKKQSDK